MNETYYYGQGKVYLARRGEDGRPGGWRWIGDVSELVITLNFENKTTKYSRGGKLFTKKRFITGYSGAVAATWLDFSADNLALLLKSDHSTSYPSIVERYELQAGIMAGDRITLPHQRIWGVVINGLQAGKDYTVDGHWGALNFINPPPTQPAAVEYEHAGGTVVPLIGLQDREYALRFEGINLAENKQSVLLELYRLSYDPLVSWQLISNGNSLSGVETNAELLSDNVSQPDDMLGQFGRLTIFDALSGITHDGSIVHDGKYNHEGNLYG